MLSGFFPFLFSPPPFFFFIVQKLSGCLIKGMMQNPWWWMWIDCMGLCSLINRVLKSTWQRTCVWWERCPGQSLAGGRMPPPCRSPELRELWWGAMTDTRPSQWQHFWFLTCALLSYFGLWYFTIFLSLWIFIFSPVVFQWVFSHFPFPVFKAPALRNFSWSFSLL